MHSLNVKYLLVLTVIFPLALLLHELAFFILPIIVPFLTALLVAIFGVAVSIGALWHLAKSRNLNSSIAVAIVSATWLAWSFIPFQEISIRAKVEFERHKYESAVMQARAGLTPTCLKSQECSWDGASRPYLLFPFPGLSSSWIGIVYVPEEDQQPLSERLSVFSGAYNCDEQPIIPHYYVCGFS